MLKHLYIIYFNLNQLCDGQRSYIRCLCDITFLATSHFVHWSSLLLCRIALHTLLMSACMIVGYLLYLATRRWIFFCAFTAPKCAIMDIYFNISIKFIVFLVVYSPFFTRSTLATTSFYYWLGYGFIVDVPQFIRLLVFMILDLPLFSGQSLRRDDTSATRTKQFINFSAFIHVVIVCARCDRFS